MVSKEKVRKNAEINMAERQGFSSVCVVGVMCSRDRNGRAGMGSVKRCGEVCECERRVRGGRTKCRGLKVRLFRLHVPSYGV